MASFSTKASRDRFVDDQPFGRHADLPHIGEGAEHRGVDRRVDVGVGEHQQRRLAAELEQHRLQMLGAELGDLLADPRGAGEVDPLDRRLGDQRGHDPRRVLGRVRDEIDDALREARLVHHLDDQAMGLRADFGGAQDHRVAAGERRGDRPHAENHGRVPRRHAEHDARSLAHGHRQHARLVGWNDFPGDLGRQRRRLAQQSRGEEAIEAAPRPDRADLLGHRFGEVCGARFDEIGRLHEQGAPQARTGLRPRGKSPMRGLDHLDDIGLARRGGLAGDPPGHRVFAREGRARGRADSLAVDDEINSHGSLPC